MGFGLYVHIPFCLSKCGYCAFFSRADQLHLRECYLVALHYQLELLAELPAMRGRVVETVFFGGGTPTTLAPERLAELLHACGQGMHIAPEAEVSIEVNPATISAAGLRTLRRTGFNRLSIGIQSLNDAELRRLGRVHTAAEGLAAFHAGRAAGFDNISLDLMFGLPGQGLAAWRRSLEQTLALEPEHLSIYELDVEEGTRFADEARAGRLNLPTEETVLAQLALTMKLTEAAGLARYEISNYARPGRECRHNLNYWHNGPYLGLGSGAVSFLDGERLHGMADIKAFCRCMQEGIVEWWDEREHLTHDAAFRETVIMGLRMLAGIDCARLRERFGYDPREYYAEILKQVNGLDLLLVEENHLRLGSSGLLLANHIMAKLV